MDLFFFRETWGPVFFPFSLLKFPFPISFFPLMRLLPPPSAEVFSSYLTYNSALAPYSRHFLFDKSLPTFPFLVCLVLVFLYVGTRRPTVPWAISSRPSLEMDLFSLEVFPLWRRHNFFLLYSVTTKMPSLLNKCPPRLVESRLFPLSSVAFFLGFRFSFFPKSGFPPSECFSPKVFSPLFCCHASLSHYLTVPHLTFAGAETALP